ncbi:MAG: NUDIX hydrolase [Pseudomonadota bacterium]
MDTDTDTDKSAQESLLLVEVDITVQVLVGNEKNEILIVAEKGDAEERGNEERKGKPPGSGLPGGNILTNCQKLRKTFFAEELIRGDVKQIINYIDVEGIDQELFEEILRFENDFPKTTIGFLIFLTAIRETLEETGLLVQPLSVLLQEEVGEGHLVIVVLAKYVAGKITKRTLETRDCNWTPLDRLPGDTYHSHEHRIVEALQRLGIRADINRGREEIWYEF